MSGPQLTEDIGIDGREIAWRKEFAGFDETDRQRLESMAGTVGSVIDETVDAFYDHLESFEETVANDVEERVAAANERQVAMVDDIDESVQRLTDGDDP